jgi:hypothetical protein
MRGRIADAVLGDMSREDRSMGAMASGKRKDGTVAPPAHNRKADPEFYVYGAGGDAFVAGRDICIHMAEFAAAAGGAGFVVPFVKAIATKAGEDCYQALRNLIRHPEQQSANQEQVRLTDPDTGTVLVYAPPMPDEAVMKLAALKPRKVANRILTWDSPRAEWKIRRKR